MKKHHLASREKFDQAIERTYNNLKEFMWSDKNPRKLYFGLHKMIFSKQYILDAILDTKKRIIKEFSKSSLD